MRARSRRHLRERAGAAVADRAALPDAAAEQRLGHRRVVEAAVDPGGVPGDGPERRVTRAGAARHPRRRVRLAHGDGARREHAARREG